MQVSTFLKSALKYVPVLVVIAVAVTGILLSKESDVQITTNTQLQGESNNSDVIILSTPTPLCMGFQIYTSLPPKCRASDGTLVQFNGFSSNFIMPPGPK
jgi:hypothetical protein